MAKIKAREIVEDIKIGLDDAALMKKYKIDENKLIGIIEKLVSAKLLRKEDLDRRQEKATCPACRFSKKGAFDVCPSCGVVVEKYLERQAEKRNSMQNSKPEPKREPKVKYPQIKFYLLIILGIACIVSLLGGFNEKKALNWLVTGAKFDMIFKNYSGDPLKFIRQDPDLSKAFAHHQRRYDMWSVIFTVSLFSFILVCRKFFKQRRKFLDA
jgi:hypothetical protein